MPADDAVTKLVGIIEANGGLAFIDLVSEDIARAVLESGVVTLTQPLHDLTKRWSKAADQLRPPATVGLGVDTLDTCAAELRALLSEPTARKSS